MWLVVKVSGPSPNMCISVEVLYLSGHAMSIGGNVLSANKWGRIGHVLSSLCNTVVGSDISALSAGVGYAGSNGDSLSMGAPLLRSVFFDLTHFPLGSPLVIEFEYYAPYVQGCSYGVVKERFIVFSWFAFAYYPYVMVLGEDGAPGEGLIFVFVVCFRLWFLFFLLLSIHRIPNGIPNIYFLLVRLGDFSFIVRSIIFFLGWLGNFTYSITALSTLPFTSMTKDCFTIYS